jgi:hypothetical protein
MTTPPNKTMQLFIAIGAITGWLAVGLQFYLIIVNRVASVPETIIRFFSFFTILTNIIVALCFTTMLLKTKPRTTRFFTRSKTITAIAVYINVVGLVYNIILRFLWMPSGLQGIVDELLHSFIPVYFVLYWLLFIPKNELQWKNVFPWLIYPFIYLVFCLSRGALSGFYPYPFIDVTALGYNKVLLNCGGLFIVFLLISLLFVAVGKVMKGYQGSR